MEGLVLLNIDPNGKGWIDWAATKVCFLWLISISKLWHTPHRDVSQHTVHTKQYSIRVLSPAVRTDEHPARHCPATSLQSGMLRSPCSAPAFCARARKPFFFFGYRRSWWITQSWCRATGNRSTTPSTSSTCSFSGTCTTGRILVRWSFQDVQIRYPAASPQTTCSSLLWLVIFNPHTEVFLP